MRNTDQLPPHPRSVMVTYPVITIGHTCMDHLGSREPSCHRANFRNLVFCEELVNSCAGVLVVVHALVNG